MLTTQRKSQLLKLSFVYDWSNPDISDDALILNVLSRCIYEDICRVAAHYGVELVEKLRRDIPSDVILDRELNRMMENIKIGFSRV